MAIYPFTLSFGLSGLAIAKQKAIALFRDLIREQEPQVHYCQTLTGSVWNVYDPYTQKFHQFTSEDEVRCWLEQRYYHS